MSNMEVMHEFEVVKKQLNKTTSKLNGMVKKGYTDAAFESAVKHREMLEERLHDIAEKLIIA